MKCSCAGAGSASVQTLVFSRRERGSSLRSEPGVVPQDLPFPLRVTRPFSRRSRTGVAVLPQDSGSRGYLPAGILAGLFLSDPHSFAISLLYPELPRPRPISVYPWPRLSDFATASAPRPQPLSLSSYVLLIIGSSVTLPPLPLSLVSSANTFSQVARLFP